MPYCSKCGAKNEEGAQVCVNCEEPLYDTERRRARRSDTCFGSREDRRMEDECFGLPHGSIIFGIIFGIIVLIFGIALVLQLVFGISIEVWTWVGPALVVIVGILILSGAIYQLRRRR